MRTHLKIIIPSYNSIKWIKRTLHSVAIQTYQNYDVCVIDDASTQAGQREFIQDYCAERKWKTIFRATNQGALANIVEGIKRLKPSDEDVILLLDGDDWLFNQCVFKAIAKEYEHPSTLLTYGQFITYPRWQIGFCKPLKEQDSKQNFRENTFIFSHLRTFKTKVWNALREEDLKDNFGKFYKTAWDLAIMYPLLELTGGGGCKFVDQILYVYNMDNPLNDCIAHRELQAAIAQEILNKKSYPQQFFTEKLPYQPRLKVQIKNHWISLYKKFLTPAVYRLALRKLIRKANFAYMIRSKKK